MAIRAHAKNNIDTEKARRIYLALLNTGGRPRNRAHDVLIAIGNTKKEPGLAAGRNSKRLDGTDYDKN